MGRIVRKRDTGEQGNRGEFGTVHREDAEVEVAHAAPADRLAWPECFDPDTADPVAFDRQLEREHAEYQRAQHDVDSALVALHFDVGDRRVGHGRSARWGLTDGETLERARGIAVTADSDQPARNARALQQHLDKLDAATVLLRNQDERTGALDAAYRHRGSWNRAFLVNGANGHVHSSMDCSTCRPTTRYAWMTQYSGADEGAIVEDAGYRACTVCYPTAPVGDAATRPTKMFTPDELAEQQQRQRREELAKLTPAEKRARKRAEKLAAAVSKNGRPLRFEEDLGEVGVMRLVLSTEKDAEREWARGLGDAILLRQSEGETLPEFTDARREDEERAAWRARVRPVIAQTLAEKHGTTPLEEKQRLDSLTRDYFEERFPRLAEGFAADDESNYR